MDVTVKVRPLLVKKLQILETTGFRAGLGVGLTKGGCPEEYILQPNFHSLTCSALICLLILTINSHSHYFFSPFTVYLLIYSLSVHPSIHPSSHSTTYPSTYPLTHYLFPSTCHYLPTHYQFTSPSIHPSISSSTHPATHVSIYPSIYPSIICPSTYTLTYHPFIYPFIHLSINPLAHP